MCRDIKYFISNVHPNSASVGKRHMWQFMEQLGYDFLLLSGFTVAHFNYAAIWLDMYKWS